MQWLSIKLVIGTLFVFLIKTKVLGASQLRRQFIMPYRNSMCLFIVFIACFVLIGCATHTGGMCR
jgi:hypothetical protein